MHDKDQNEPGCRESGDKSALKESIGARFRQMREFVGLSQKETGELFDMKQSNIARIEKGIVSPNMAICDYFHAHFSINLNWLITGEGEMVEDEEPALRIIPNYGEFKEEMKELMFHLDHVPNSRIAILKYFMGYKLENKKKLMKYLQQHNLKK